MKPCLNKVRFRVRHHVDHRHAVREPCCDNRVSETFQFAKPAVLFALAFRLSHHQTRPTPSSRLRAQPVRLTIMPQALGSRIRSGSLGIFAAMRRASSSEQLGRRTFA